MALIEIVMPRMGESIMECTVITWLKKPGDRVEADESILEVATDKVDTEVPAPQAGTLHELLVNDGDVVAVGAPIARLAVGEDVASAPSAPSSAPMPNATSQPAAETATLSATEPALAEVETDVVELAAGLEASVSAMSTKTKLAEEGAFAGRFYSPLVLNIAKEEGLKRDELDRIPGTGAGGRLTKKDILGYVMQRVEGPLLGEAAAGVSAATNVASAPAAGTPAATSAKTQAKPSAPSPTPKAQSVNGQTDIIQMDRMRKLIAQRMVESKQTSPHVTSFVEADLTTLVQWRTRVKDQFKRQTGENLTFTPLLIEAIVRAIKDFPMINVSVEGDTILVKKSINVGMAVALPTGNLIVPVIHDAAQYNLVGLAKRVNDLSQRARDNKLQPDDLANGTYTVSNIGTFGNLMGTPIIMQPQVAIMAFGAIVKKPAVIETPQGDLIGIRHLMFLSHSYDHRVVDGALGGQFVRRVADYLENFDPERTF